jgi:tripartite-type tricarboxylate transporter receptor subunit TctC
MHYLKLATLVLFSVLGGPAFTADYPTKPIRMVVPFPPGGGVDVAARVISQSLSQRLGQPVVVENVSGAGGNIGADKAAKAPADGYTILFGSGALAINPSLYKNLPFDPVRDFAPVSLILTTPFVLMASNASPIRTIKELADAAKSAPGKLQYASAGNGSASHLFTELLTTELGIKLTHVAYRGATPAMNDVLGGHVPIVFDSIITTLRLIRAGKVRAIAVSSKTRSSVAPEIPTVAESGVPGFEAANWMGLLVPTGTPKDIIGRLGSEAAEGLKDPAVRERMKELGAEAIGSSPEAFDRYFRGELAKWSKVARDAKVELN